MAHGETLAEDGPGSTELPSGSLSAAGLAEALRVEIMDDVEAVLREKAKSLWERGQEELGKMKEDRKEVASSIAELQKRQDVLIGEQTAMHSALLDITTKMEFVAMEMREALRTVGKVGADGVVPAEALGTPLALPLGAPVQLLPDLSALALSAALQGMDLEGMVEPGLALHGAGLCTPPRITPHAVASPLGPSMLPPLPGSPPAVLINLASALPSAPTPSLPGGTTRLHIADCLDLNGSSPVSACDPKDSPAHAISSVSTSSSPLLGGVGSSSAGSPYQVDMSSPMSADGGLDAALQDAMPPGLAKASSATLRADAPAFVPGGFS